jgi:hypothetical protein
MICIISNAHFPELPELTDTCFHWTCSIDMHEVPIAIRLDLWLTCEFIYYSAKAYRN